MSGGPIMILAGGTGGHVFPGLAVANALRERSQPVVWMGTRAGLEARLVPEAGIDVEWISVTGVRGRGLFAWVAAPFKILIAIAQALAVLRRRRPEAVLGLGGFVSGPGGIAAWLTRRPLLIHEQNAVAGTTNRILARFANRVFAAFPGSFPGDLDVELVGNPVRSSILAIPVPAERFAARRGRPVRILVIGGSQGARVLNERVPGALALLDERFAVEIWHQAGRGLDAARAAYAEVGRDVRLEAFIDEIAAAYSWADLVICRAGALTVSELAAAGVGAVLIPFPYAIDDHQLKNALSFAQGGAGIVIPESEFDTQRLALELTRLLEDHDALLRLAENARAQAKPRATEIIADACLQFAEVRA
ncbi:MAG TPA: undecaprenyldiphospho-muramoylpentapeptide beta-N-acetylglucosaminyltransferase [Gammaproteobacteria bacterium]